MGRITVPVPGLVSLPTRAHTAFAEAQVRVLEHQLRFGLLNLGEDPPTDSDSDLDSLSNMGGRVPADYRISDTPSLSVQERRRRSLNSNYWADEWAKFKEDLERKRAAKEEKKKKNKKDGEKKEKKGKKKGEKKEQKSEKKEQNVEKPEEKEEEEVIPPTYKEIYLVIE